MLIRRKVPRGGSAVNYYPNYFFCECVYMQVFLTIKIENTTLKYQVMNFSSARDVVVSYNPWSVGPRGLWCTTHDQHGGRSVKAPPAYHLNYLIIPMTLASWGLKSRQVWLK